MDFSWYVEILVYLCMIDCFYISYSSFIKGRSKQNCNIRATYFIHTRFCFLVDMIKSSVFFHGSLHKRTRFWYICTIHQILFGYKLFAPTTTNICLFIWFYVFVRKKTPKTMYKLSCRVKSVCFVLFCYNKFIYILKILWFCVFLVCLCGSVWEFKLKYNVQQKIFSVLGQFCYSRFI